MVIQGNILDFMGVFAAGVMVGLTPCVYPLVPVTAALIVSFYFCGSSPLHMQLTVTKTLLGTNVPGPRNTFHGTIFYHPFGFFPIAGNPMIQVGSVKQHYRIRWGFLNNALVAGFDTLRHRTRAIMDSVFGIRLGLEL